MSPFSVAGLLPGGVVVMDHVPGSAPASKVCTSNCPLSLQSGPEGAIVATLGQEQSSTNIVTVAVSAGHAGFELGTSYKKS